MGPTPFRIRSMCVSGHYTDRRARSGARKDEFPFRVTTLANPPTIRAPTVHAMSAQGLVALRPTVVGGYEAPGLMGKPLFDWIVLDVTDDAVNVVGCVEVDLVGPGRPNRMIVGHIFECA